MDNLNNEEMSLDVSWQEINKEECEEASYNNIGCWKEFD